MLSLSGKSGSLMNLPLLDQYQRPLHDLRISVTDRCNFRCRYCMPKEVFGSAHTFLPHSALLTFEEITRLTQLFMGFGLRKVRLTGGEPLLRKGFTTLVSMLVAIDGLTDVALTTNGSLLTERADALREAGLSRLTVSLDALDDTTFQAMNDVNFPVAHVLSGIQAAECAGFKSIKVNVVVQNGVNDHAVVEIARYFQGSGHIVRFIEYMDVGSTNGWRNDDVLPAEEIVSRIHAVLPLERIAPNYVGEVATRYRYLDGSGEIGVIASVTRPFCGACTRARLSSEGSLYTCLFGSTGTNIGKVMRAGATDDDIRAVIHAVWSGRRDRYSEVRSTQDQSGSKVEMSHIGG